MPFFTYDKKSARFRDSNGRFITAEKVQGQIQKLTDKLEKDFRSSAKQLNQGKINIAEFQNQMKDLIKSSHTIAGAVAGGGRAHLSQSDWGKIGAKVREQYKFLNQFARDIENGRVSPAQIEHRASTYKDAVRLFFAEIELQKQLEIDSEAKRELHATESCTDCISWAAKGWIKTKEMAPLGTLICKRFCKCTIKYRQPVKVFKSSNDPARKYYGAGSESHPEEWNQTIDYLKNEGVDVKIEGVSMVYGPSSTKGNPGNLRIAKSASISALRHELYHYEHDKARNFPGMRFFFEKYEERWRSEFRAYVVELKFAREAKNADLAREIIAEMRQTRKELREWYGISED